MTEEVFDPGAVASRASAAVEAALGPNEVVRVAIPCTSTSAVVLTSQRLIHVRDDAVLQTWLASWIRGLELGLGGLHFHANSGWSAKAGVSVKEIIIAAVDEP